MHMIVTKANDFYRNNDEAHVPCVGIESDNMGSCLAEIRRNDLRGVFGTRFHGFHHSDLDFLSQVPQIEAVWLKDVTLLDIKGIYALNDLQFFCCRAPRPEIDFSKLPTLKKLIIEPHAIDRGWEKLTGLEALHVWHYRPRTRDFSRLTIPRDLRELHIMWMNIETLSVLPELPKLERLEVHRCRYLSDLSDLRKKFPALKHFVVKFCGKLSDEEIARVEEELKDLEFVSIQEETE